MAEHTDFATLERPSSPNTYLLAPAGLCQSAEPDTLSPTFEADPGALFQAVQDLAASKDRWTVSSTAAETMQIEAVAATKLLKFKDDVTIRVLEDKNDGHKSQLAVYSRSRVGYHDMGANRKRIEKLIEELKARVGKTA
ncbi:MAG: DUF1499 domain-containing protein [Henriciella sp.]|uniref:DUF1499 domain-containing protein n=1 Tax=Henriciella sp. TaxID=1968823 RepID=UPI003C75488B